MKKDYMFALLALRFLYEHVTALPWESLRDAFGTPQAAARWPTAGFPSRFRHGYFRPTGAPVANAGSCRGMTMSAASRMRRTMS